MRGRWVDTALEREIFITLRIGHNVKDRTKKYVMSIFTFLDPPPSWKIYVMSLFTFLDPSPSWKIYVMSLFTFLDPPPSWKIYVMSRFPFSNDAIYVGLKSPLSTCNSIYK